MMGVYKIENLANGKVYVGSSQSINRRKSYHFSLLRKNSHPNKHLQSAYNKYGREKFVFSIIQECDGNSLIENEQKWIDFYWEQGTYNVARVAGASFRGRKHTRRTRSQISNWYKSNPHPMQGKNHTDESKNQILVTCTEKFKHRRKLSEEQVREVITLHSSGIGAGKIASLYGVSKPTIQKILNGKRYRLVTLTDLPS